MQNKVVGQFAPILMFISLLSFHGLSYGVAAYIPETLKRCITSVYEPADKSNNTKHLQELYAIIAENRMLASDNLMRNAVEEALGVVEKNGNIFRSNVQKDVIAQYLNQYLASLDEASVLLAMESDAACASWPTSLVARCLSDNAGAADLLHLSSELTYNQNVLLYGNSNIDFASEYLPREGVRSPEDIHFSAPSVMFNANMMTNSVLSAPNMIFGTGVSSPSINAWAMSVSSVLQSPINIQFAVPVNFKRKKPVSLELMFLVKQQSVPNGNGRIRINAEYIKNGDDFDISDPVPTFTQTIDSSNFRIVQPSGFNDVKYLYVSIPLDKSVIAKHKFAFYSLTRIAPTSGSEYSADIYLAAATFRYTEKK